MFAAHKKTDNLIAAIDWNGQQIDGPTAKVMNLGDLAGKFLAFGWEVIHLDKGNDMDEIIKALTQAKSLTGRVDPLLF